MRIQRDENKKKTSNKKLQNKYIFKRKICIFFLKMNKITAIEWQTKERTRLQHGYEETGKAPSVYIPKETEFI